MMKKIFSLCAIAILLSSINLHTIFATQDDVAFTDINGHWAQSYIIEGHNEGLITGYNDQTFRPNDSVTGDQFLAMMYRAVDDGGGYFSAEFISGLYNHLYFYYEWIMQAQIKLSFDFNNAQEGYWAQPFVDFAYESHYLDVSDKVFLKNDPDAFKKPLTREMAAYLIGRWTSQYEFDYHTPYRLYLARTDLLYKDMKSFTNIDQTYYKIDATLNGIMMGFPEEKFYPQKLLTRAEATAIILRLKHHDKRTPDMPKPTDKYFVETEDRIVMVYDKKNRDAFNGLYQLFHNSKVGATAHFFNSTMWYASEERKEEFDYSITRGWGFSNGTTADLTFYSSDEKNLRLAIYRKFDFNDKKNSNLLNESLKIFTENKDVSRLRANIDKWFENYEDQTFVLNGETYKLQATGDTVTIYRYY